MTNPVYEGPASQHSRELTLCALEKFGNGRIIADQGRGYFLARRWNIAESTSSLTSAA